MKIQSKILSLYIYVYMHAYILFNLIWCKSIIQFKNWPIWTWKIRTLLPASQTYYRRRLKSHRKKLRKLLTKVPNYREPKNINFRKDYFETDKKWKACIEKSTKNKLETSTLIHWRESVLIMVKKKRNFSRKYNLNKYDQYYVIVNSNRI